MRTTALAAACVVAGAVLAACGSAGTTGTHAQSGSAGAPDAETQRIVQCYRTHGDPTFPDPVYDPGDGRWHFAISPATAPQSTRQACQHLFPSATASPPVSQAQFARLLQFAGCIRRHGVPGWPDPNPQGQFGLPPSLLNKSPAQTRAFAACHKYIPSGGINVVAGPS